MWCLLTTPLLLPPIPILVVLHIILYPIKWQKINVKNKSLAGGGEQTDFYLLEALPFSLNHVLLHKDNCHHAEKAEDCI